MATYAYTFTSGDTITPTKLNNARTVSEIVNADIGAAAAIGLSKLATGALPTAITVASANILDANVTAAKLASNAVETAKIADDAVTNNKLSLAANAGEIKKALNADNAPPIFACRAWVNFDGTKDTTGTASTANTNRLVRASGNVTSVLRNSAGNYTLTFTTAMPDANYCLQTMTSGDGVDASFVYEANSAVSRNTAGTSSIIIQVVNKAGTPADRASNSVAVFR